MDGFFIKKILHGVGVDDIITSTSFYDYRLRGFCVVGGRIWGFDSFRSCPYNSVYTIILDVIVCRCCFRLNQILARALQALSDPYGQSTCLCMCCLSVCLFVCRKL